MASTENKAILGFIVVIILSTAVIINSQNNLKIRIDNDKATFYVLNENNRFVVAGREYNKIMEGSSNLYRKAREISLETIIDNESNKTSIIRTTPYIRGPVIIDTWNFDGNIKDIKQFPISHTVEIINGTGFYYKYEVKDLDYAGDTFKLDGSQTRMTFGKNMKVTWWDNYRLGWVYKSGSMYVKSEKITDDYVKFNVRLFDPPALVQSKAFQGASQTNPISVSFDSSVTAGNLVVVALTMWGISNYNVGDVTDNQGNTYTKIIEVEDSGSNAVHAALYYSNNVLSSGTFTVEIDLSYLPDDTPTQSISVYEISDISDTSALVDSNSGQSASSTTPTTGSMTAADDDSFIIGVLNIDGASTVTAGSGFSLQEQITTDTRHYSESQTNDAGSYTVNYTLGTARTYAVVGAIFKTTGEEPPDWRPNCSIVNCYDSDYLNKANGIDIVFVDKRNGNCSNWTRSTAMSGTSPWCNISTANYALLACNDTVLFSLGNYTTEGHYIDMDKDCSGNNLAIVLTSYHSNETWMQGNYYEAYLNNSNNGLWTQTNATSNYWETSASVSSSSVCNIYYENGTQLYTYNTEASSKVFNHNDYPFGCYCDSSGNDIGCMFPAGKNPNNLKLWVSSGAQYLFELTGNRAEIHNVTTLYATTPFHLDNGDNVILKDFVVQGCSKRCVYPVGGTDNLLVEDFEIHAGHPEPVYWYTVKSLAQNNMEKSCINPNDVTGVNHIYQNGECHDAFNGLFHETSASNHGAGFIYKNIFINNIYDDAIEIEQYCNNTFFQNITTNNSFVALSIAPTTVANSGETCTINYSILRSDRNITYQVGTEWDGEVIKSDKWGAAVYNHQNILIDHCTLINDGGIAVFRSTNDNTFVMRNTSFRNNIYVSDGLILTNTGNHTNVRFTYAYYYQPTGDFGDDICVEGVGPTYATLADAKPACGSWFSEDAYNTINSPFTDWQSDNLVPTNGHAVCTMDFTGSYLGALPCASAQNITNPSIIFNSPSSQTFENENNVSLTVTCSDESGIKKISLYVNGTLNVTNTTPINNTPWTYKLSVNYTNYSMFFRCWDGEYCYQEFANVSTVCGGLDTGTYSSTGNHTDGNYSTFINLSEDYNFNYTIPNGTILNSSKIQIKINETLYNFTIPSACGNIDNSLLFRYRLGVRYGLVVGHYLFCSKNGNWTNSEQENINFFGDSSDLLNFYEEAMFWDIESNFNTTETRWFNFNTSITDSCIYTGSGDWRIVDNCTLSVPYHVSGAFIINDPTVTVEILADIIAESCAVIKGAKLTNIPGDGNELAC